MSRFVVTEILALGRVAWLDIRVKRQTGSMHVDTRPRTYTAVDGSVRQYRQALLRRSYRDAAGQPAKQTLANLSVLPDEAVEALRQGLAEENLVGTQEAVRIQPRLG